MILSTQTHVPLADIVGTSPLNPRPHPGTDLDGLCASIVAAGLLQPLLVVAVDSPIEDRPLYETLDGSRRWHALQRVAIETGYTPRPDVPVVILTGTEAELREVALAANFHRLDLHPVERYEAFAALVKAGMSLEQIARDFHLEQRDIRKALALGALHADVRLAWKAGTIDADQATAFTAVGDQAAQSRLLPDVVANALAPKEIRARLRGDAVPGSDPRALFAQGEYLAAGGTIDDSLFEDQSFFRDATLLDRVSREKRQALADDIARAEGWGVAAIDNDGFAPDGHLRPAYLAREEERAHALNAELEADALSDDEARAAERELADIDRKAILRAAPQGQRGRYGVLVEIDADGAVIVTRGMALAAGKVAGRNPGVVIGDEVHEAAETARGPRASQPSPPAVEDPPSSRAVRAVLDAAIVMAFSRCIARRPDVAIMLALAHVAGGPGQYSGLRMTGGGCSLTDAAPPLLRAVADRPFPDALATLAGAENLDCITAFTAAVAACIDVRDVSLGALEPLVKAMAARHVTLGAELDAALDRVAYFRAATREAALDVIRALLGEAAAAEAAAKKKAVIADEAARIAKDRRWLPSPLSVWAAMGPASPPHEAPRAPDETLAKAMHNAIEADAEGRLVERFLAARTHRAEGALVHASKLHAAFVSWCIDEGVADIPALRPFGAIMTRLGYERHRLADGSHYRRLALAEALRTAAE